MKEFKNKILLSVSTWANGGFIFQDRDHKMSSSFEVGQMRFLWDFQLEISFRLVNTRGLKPKGND